jgi:hypothetical protein
VGCYSIDPARCNLTSKAAAAAGDAHIDHEARRAGCRLDSLAPDSGTGSDSRGGAADAMVVVAVESGFGACSQVREYDVVNGAAGDFSLAAKW